MGGVTLCELFSAKMLDTFSGGTAVGFPVVSRKVHNYAR